MLSKRSKSLRTEIDGKAMDNSMILQMVSLQTECNPGGNTKGVQAEKGAADFLSTIRESMKSSSKDSLQQPEKPAPAHAAHSDEYHSYLESLRKDLLAKGKSLDKISLSTEDLPLVKKLLFQLSVTFGIDCLGQELGYDNRNKGDGKYGKGWT